MDEKAKKLVCFGNSITQGWRVREDQSWPWIIQQSLPFRVINAGISGETSLDGLRRLDSIIELEPTWCIIEFGINDFYNGFTVEQTRTNLDAIINALKEHETRPALMGFDLREPASMPWTVMYRDLSDLHQIPLMPDLFTGLWGEDGTFMEDGLHPTAKGYQIIARNCLETFSNTLWQ